MKIVIDYKFEEWKKIENLQNYEISNYGRVRNVKKQTILKGCINKYGYYIQL